MQLLLRTVEILKETRGLRRQGSAALELANLACGWYQGFWESELQAYDVAAAILMLEENGCQTVNHLGKAYNIFEDRILIAGLPGVTDELLAILQEYYHASII